MQVANKCSKSQYVLKKNPNESTNPTYGNANSTKKCSNDNLKSALTTIKKCSNDNYHKILYFNRKSLCNILGAEWHLLPLGEEKDNIFKFI